MIERYVHNQVKMGDLDESGTGRFGGLGGAGAPVERAGAPRREEGSPLLE